MDGKDSCHVGFFCCSYHHSMYCPECRGDICWDRLFHGLNPEYGHQEENELKVKRYLEKQNESTLKNMD